MSLKRKGGRFAVICDYEWLESYLVFENYHFVRLLHEEYGFDIIQCSDTDFYHKLTLEHLSTYEAILVTYHLHMTVPINLFTSFCVLKIDDLENYDDSYTNFVRFAVRNSEMVISPYAYNLPNFFSHNNVKWIPYSSPVVEEGGILPFNQDPIPRVLASGSVAWDRPFRTYVFELEDDRIVKLGHPGYFEKYGANSEQIVRARWFRELNKYLVAFCDAHSLRYIHIRAFEIASVGALLLADRLVEKEMNELGFVDGETCMFCDQSDFLEKVSWSLDPNNRSRVDEIRTAGMQVALERHLTRTRVSEFVATLEAALAPA